MGISTPTPKIITARYHLEDSHTLPVAQKAGAYAVAREALTRKSPEQIRDEVKKGNLRGRGGAGFPAGVKWGFLNPRPGQEVYLVVNGDESEPGTFKDRTILERDPHRLVEGIVISCFAIGAHKAFVYIRGELRFGQLRLERALEEAREKGFVGKRPFGVDHPIDVVVHSGAGAYICGEETALLNSLEGRRGEPRIKPPFPAVEGAFRMPTIVNNLETIATVPGLVEMGGDAFAALGLVPGDGGTRLFGVSGHVARPGIYEAPAGLPLRELIYDLGGGLLDPKRTLKAVIPGGSSTPVLRPDRSVKASDPQHPLHAYDGKSELDVPMAVDLYRALGTMLGTCCATVMDDTVNMVEVTRNLMHFYKHESCGQCTPCREGTGWLLDVLDQIATGRGKASDVDLLIEIANNMMGNTICAFADGTAMPLLGMVRQFEEEFRAAVQLGRPLDARHDETTRARFGGSAA
jgi:NADH-quinone oxidoreductase subunit F